VHLPRSGSRKPTAPSHETTSAAPPPCSACVENEDGTAGQRGLSGGLAKAGHSLGQLEARAGAEREGG